MSPFNWFNRNFDQSEAEAPSPENSPAAEPTPENAADPASEESAAPAIESDYLNWAKAAYQTIQKRQAEQAAVPAASDRTTAEPEETVAQAEPETAPLSEAPATPAVESVVLDEETSPDTAADVIPSPETVADVDLAEPEPAAEAAEPAVAALPFWAQAEAERQERLEKLKAEAIAEAEPEPAPVASSDAVTTASALEMDENFIWSAGILAAQGRRPDQVDLEEITWLKRLRQGLDKTRRSLVNQLKAIVGQGPLNQDAVMEIESLLLQADVGVEATDYIIEALQSKLRQEALPPDQAIAYLKQILRDMLERPYDTYSPTFAPEKDTLNIWLITGVNGAGKTTTIGKIAHVASKSGYRCLIGAADTFRAAAVQQVKVWGERSQVDVIANPGKNTDPAAVVFDAIAAAQSRHTELLLVDTAGRLQNKKNLMDELTKIRRIIDKKAPGATVESLLVLDATLGQNGLRQAEVFAEAAQLSGVVLTKLDGTAKGGVALAVVQQLGLPIRFIGAGEGIEDLRPFSSYEFVEALLSG